jgi:hypothetical protein
MRCPGLRPSHPRQRLRASLLRAPRQGARRPPGSWSRGAFAFPVDAVMLDLCEPQRLNTVHLGTAAATGSGSVPGQEIPRPGGQGGGRRAARHCHGPERGVATMPDDLPCAVMSWFVRRSSAAQTLVKGPDVTDPPLDSQAQGSASSGVGELRGRRARTLRHHSMNTLVPPSRCSSASLGSTRRLARPRALPSQPRRRSPGRRQGQPKTTRTGS